MRRASQAWRIFRRRDPVLGEEVVRAVGGARMPEVLFSPRRGTRQKFALVAVRFGAANLAWRQRGGGRRVEVPPGAAHFLEHELFEGEAVGAFDRFARIGVSANAHTDYDETAYHFSCVRRFGEAFRHLLALVLTPRFTGPTVRRERKVIQEEIRMYADDSDAVCLQNLQRALFARHPARFDIAGSAASVRRVTLGTLRDCYRAFYHPANLVVVVAGDVALSGVLEAVREAFSGRDPPGACGIPLEIREPLSLARRRVRRRMDVAAPKILVGFKEARVGLRGRALLRQRFLAALAGDLLFGPASAFREEAYSAGLIDEDFGFGYEGGEGFGYSVVGGRTPKPEKLREAIRARLDRAVREGPAPDDFERVRAKAVGGHLRIFHSPAGLGRILASCHFVGVDLFDYGRVLASLRLEEVASRMREHFREDAQAISLIEPA